MTLEQRERYKVYMRKWNSLNPEKRRIKHAEWQRANRDHVREYRLKWYWANRDKFKAYHLRYKTRHPDLFRLTNERARQKYIQAHPLKFKAMQMAQKAYEKGIGVYQNKPRNDSNHP